MGNPLIPSEDGTLLTNVAGKQLISQAVTVGTSAVKIGGVNPRTVVIFQNLSAGIIYMGGSDVTTANGIMLHNTIPNSFDCLSDMDLYLISDTVSQDVRFAEAI